MNLAQKALALLAAVATIGGFLLDIWDRTAGLRRRRKLKRTSQEGGDGKPADAGKEG